ncbi:hypothetical protein GCM10017784_38600 [Deinococcus indicus]|nr:hypothetical protein GCM10017784_38600 [Deinococcus indicus]
MASYAGGVELLLLSALTGIALLAVLMFWRARRAPSPDADLRAGPREAPSALERQLLARLGGDGARLERLLDLVRRQHPGLPREELLIRLQAQMDDSAG